MQKWMAAALIVAVLTAAGCRGKAQSANGGGAGSEGGGGTATAANGGAPADEETVPGGFTVDTQKVENLKGAGTTVNEPD